MTYRRHKQLLPPTLLLGCHRKLLILTVPTTLLFRHLLSRWGVTWTNLGCLHFARKNRTSRHSVLTFEQPRRFASFVSLIQRCGALLEILGRRISRLRWVARW